MCVKCTLVQVPIEATGSPEAGVTSGCGYCKTNMGPLQKQYLSTISSAPWKWIYSHNLIRAGLLFIIFLLLWSSEY